MALFFFFSFLVEKWKFHNALEMMSLKWVWTIIFCTVVIDWSGEISDLRFSLPVWLVLCSAQVANGADKPEKWVNSDSIPSIVAFRRRRDERARAHRVLWARCDFPSDVCCDRHKTVEEMCENRVAVVGPGLSTATAQPNRYWHSTRA